jgi:cobalamin biosynthesis protein CobD/CbiB
MVRDFCTSGNHERLKGCVHGAAVVIAAAMAGYNIAASVYRRDPHLKINALIYSLAVLWEVKQTAHHLKRVAATPDTPPDRIRAA